MDHLVIIVSICMGESIRVKRLRHCWMWSLWWHLAQAKIRYRILWHLIWSFCLLLSIIQRYQVYKDINPYMPSVLFMGHRQTVQIQIRHRMMLCLIRNFTVCLQNLLLKFWKKKNTKYNPTPLKLEMACSNDSSGELARLKWVKSGIKY